MKIIDKYNNGELSLLDTVLELNAKKAEMKDAIFEIESFVRDHFSEIETEAKEFENKYKGFKFQFNQGRTMYSYKNIPEWQEYNKNLKACENRYKSFLKAKMEGAAYANVNEDGEEITLPEISYGKPFLVLK